MDSFNALKRRTTDLLGSIPQSIQNLHIGGGSHHTHRGGGPSMRGTWEKIPGLPPLNRSSHSLNIIAGNAYIFGGESSDARQPVDNDMHVITLPSGSASADYYTIQAKPIPTTTTIAQPPPADTIADVPQAPLEAPPSVPLPRVGHATAVIGHRIFLFGGRGGADLSALDEGGRVWVFDTRARAWSFLDPSSPTASPSPVPEPRSYHVAVATDKPRDFNQAAPHHHTKPVTRADTWREWALGDSEEMGIPQRPIVGNVAARATDADAEGYGTLIIHGGCLSGGGRAKDVWAFDVHSRSWQRLPDAPGPGRGGPALAISRSRLYRFGGFDGEREQGGQLDFLELGVDSFNDEFSAGEVSVSAAHGGKWQSLVYGKEDVGYKEPDPADAPLTGSDEADPWPGARSVARLEAVTVGGGREYLVLMLGERDPSSAGHEAAGRFWDDVWAFQVPAQGMSTASLTDTVLSAVGRKSGEGQWSRLHLGPYDDEDDESAAGPGARGWFASAPMGELEENGIVLWGGLDGENKRLGDGWVLRLG